MTLLEIGIYRNTVRHDMSVRCVGGWTRFLQRM